MKSERDLTVSVGLWLGSPWYNRNCWPGVEKSHCPAVYIPIHLPTYILHVSMYLLSYLSIWLCIPIYHLHNVSFIYFPFTECVTGVCFKCLQLWSGFWSTDWELEGADLEVCVYSGWYKALSVGFNLRSRFTPNPLIGNIVALPAFRTKSVHGIEKVMTPLTGFSAPL